MNGTEEKVLFLKHLLLSVYCRVVNVCFKYLMLFFNLSVLIMCLKFTPNYRVYSLINSCFDHGINLN